MLLLSSGACLSPVVELGFEQPARVLPPSAPPSAGSHDDDFEEDALDDLEVSTSDGRVEICVWDDQCQDGDAIRVSVDGASYDVKLRNDRDCRVFRLRRGWHRVDLLALNGTGFEGDCSHTDENTGAIAIGAVGESSSSQSWAHRGGTGSSARLLVSVP